MDDTSVDRDDSVSGGSGDEVMDAINAPVFPDVVFSADPATTARTPTGPTSSPPTAKSHTRATSGRLGLEPLPARAAQEVGRSGGRSDLPQPSTSRIE